MQAFSWIILVHFYKRIKPACTRYKMPWTQTPVSDSSQKEMLTERVQEAVTYFFHFTSLSIHHWFSQKLCLSAVTLTFMNLRILLVNPLTSLCFWPPQHPVAMSLRGTLCVPLSWTPTEEDLFHFPPVVEAASLCSTTAALCCTFHFFYNLSKREGGGRGREGPELRALF